MPAYDNPEKAKNAVELKGFPMPPSANNLYATIGRGGRHIRVKSADCRAYHKDCQAWAIKNAVALSEARLMSLACGKGVALRLDHIYYFNRARVISKAGTPKKRDIFNLQKALHDALSELLGVDDKFFFEGAIERGYTEHPAFPETVDLWLSLTEF